ncbi:MULTISPECIES: response regulator [Sedimenticola]|uniref:Two-component system response regulator OmpR n=1 Tax=Sedimenticola selenatireducens TaxID=191960 RepID=A0A2N6CX65_9GAMM|nr:MULTISPECIES: response regulator [Sedimenticola]MCW8903712.1 response regulator [Sedimenticola sp.]PLX61888.1 MAG: two-component system response regulator OmpR [Sedimenticola selenatireducens]
MSEQTGRLLVVDDEPELRALLKRYLTEQGYQVEAVADGTAMERYLKKQPVDLIILDLMMPGDDGLTLARRLRQQGDQAIIMLSARGDEVDKIVGLEVGADDYLTKPFNPRELLARVRAVLRRSPQTQPTHATPGEVIRFGPFELNLYSHKLSRGQTDIPLTAGEFELLRIFAQHPNSVLSRDRLLNLTKGYERAPFDRSIDVRVNRLRRKIETDVSEPHYLRTIWGAGYLFSPDT